MEHIGKARNSLRCMSIGLELVRLGAKLALGTCSSRFIENSSAVGSPPSSSHRFAAPRLGGFQKAACARLNCPEAACLWSNNTRTFMRTKPASFVLLGGIQLMRRKSPGTKKIARFRSMHLVQRPSQQNSIPRAIDNRTSC